MCLGEVHLMSTHNEKNITEQKYFYIVEYGGNYITLALQGWTVQFHGEIRKIFTYYPLLSGAMMPFDGI